MSEAFDPYHKWLGIRPEEQPPHHYRLLGIQPFESDPGVIAAAAENQATRITVLSSGNESAESRKVLGEIAAARACLLDLQKKAEYDRRLRPRIEAEKEGYGPAPRPAPRVSAAAPRPTPPVGARPGESALVFSHLARCGAPRRRSKLAVAVGAAATVTAAVLVFCLSRGSDTTTGPQPAVLPPTVGKTSSERSTVAPPAPAKTEVPAMKTSAVEPPAGQSPTRKPSEILPPAIRQPEPTSKPAAAPARPPEETPPAADPGRPLADLIDPPDPQTPKTRHPTPTPPPREQKP